jgi:hypothetical protein
VRIEFFTAVTMKNVVMWDITQRDYCRNRRFRVICGLNQDENFGC